MIQSNPTHLLLSIQLMALNSTYLSALVLELAEQATAKEATLSTPQDRIQVNYNREQRLVSIVGSLQASIVVDAGKLELTAVNYTADSSLDLTGTPIASSGASNYASALMVSIAQLSNAENAFIAGGGTLPAGVGALMQFTSDGDLFTFQVDMPITATQDSAGRTVIAVPDYLD